VVTKRELRALLATTEAAYRQCWETLVRTKTRDTSDALNYRQRLLDFQPTLAAALFELDASYRQVRLSEKVLIGRKSILSPVWFRKRMRALARYREALTRAIEIGHGLGDSFAWLFYARDRQSLRAHLKVQGQRHLPPGIGGRGELEFLRQVKGVGSQIAIYHGTTTFLRIGDVSLFDLTDGKLVGIGEIKTAEIKPGSLQLSLHMVTSRGPSAASTVKQHREENWALPQAPDQRLRRQMKAMARALIAQKQKRNADRASTISGGAHLQELDSLYQRIRRRGVAYQRAGNGLILAGLRVGNGKLATQLLERSRINLESRFSGVRHEAMRTMATDSADNALHVGYIDLRLQLGATPLFWWPVSTDLLRDLIFGDVMIMTIYNPAHFFARLRELGFSIEGHSKGEYRVSKLVNGHRAQLHAIDYFLDAIQRNLLREEAALEAIRQLMDPIESGKVKPRARVEMEMRMYWL
jgi:hypothetical protein